ncbi:bone morphogenetic protein 7-like [Plakobranchus ocellatus]|uniref:Bone morphogenetic protein 7-like n=1 Tax=Plakobranchus ocellatus TaxID=259542 RepID=A0AAV3ZP38_9GAST|nr:bone morphogenetic protein 7-like [Plakobranchus ocellatus]
MIGCSTASSSSLRSHFWRSWVLVLLATAVVISLVNHQVKAAPGSARSGSSYKSRRFYRVGFSPDRPYHSMPSSYSSSSSLSESPTEQSSSPYSQQSSSSSSFSSSFAKSESKPDALTRLSKVFGISRIPHGNIHRSPPQYMQELYASTTDTGGLTRARGPYNSNTIRSFPDKDSVHRMHFHYNVSYLEKEERILQAEFRIFKMRPEKSHSGLQRMPHVILVKVFQVLDIRDMTQSTNLRLLEARRVSAHAHGWYVFNVTSAVLAWHYGTANNFGILVTAQTASGQHVNGSYVRFAQRNEHHDSKQPVLVIFAEDEERKHANYISPEDEGYRQMKEDLVKHELRKKRRKTSGLRDAIRMLNERERRRNRRYTRSVNAYSGIFDSRSTVRVRRATRYRRNSKNRGRGGGRGGGGRRKRTYDVYRRYRHKSRTCSRYEMFVDFEEIGWSGWIISPNSYNAYRCDGKCPFPLGQSQKPTNHATVQSIVHALTVGKDVGTPCCVPNKLYSISLLYFDDNENVILKQYDDMVVASCGCH